MKVALGQLDFHIGNFQHNTRKITDSIHAASCGGADLVVFPELAISGYPPGDLLDYDHFIARCGDALQHISRECVDIAAIVGVPMPNTGMKGKRLYNTACFLHQGKVKAVTRKSLLPTYDIFDEYRYFEPDTTSSVVSFQGKRIAITICEDLWGLGDNPMYVTNPMDRLARENPHMIINIAASPFDYSQGEKRLSILQANAKKYNLPLIYVNQTGAHAQIIFDGGSMVIDKQGRPIMQMPFFEERTEIFDTQRLTATNDHAAPALEILKYPHRTERLYQALRCGTADFFRKSGFKKAVLGLSGGLDSALTLAIAADALGPQNVMSLIMPSRFSNQHSIDDSLKITQNLESPKEIVSIEEGFNALENTLKPFFKNMPFDTTEENLQARLRATLLMAFSNKKGYLLLNTSNKSEAAVGYGTLYGDMCGGLSIIGDIYKTEAWQLAKYINRDKEIIPESIIYKAPSAELRPNQKDSDSLPPYHVLDKLLYMYIEEQKSPQQIMDAGFDKEMVSKVLKLVNNSEHKRFQAPPVLRVSPKAFGSGRRMPLTARYQIP